MDVNDRLKGPQIFLVRTFTILIITKYSGNILFVIILKINTHFKNH